jgi:hypothetical protein
MKKRKNNSNVPRHKRLERALRLQAAKFWIPKYDRENLVKGYSKHFGVDKLCAVKELALLGYTISDEYVKQLKRSLEDQIRINQKRKELRKEKSNADIDGDYEDMFWEFEEWMEKEDDYGKEEMPF